ncbi:MAG TPA: hypothetical protein VJ553_05985, partial [Candidatus Paceibacterota bacterium]|nr:hypothetical protein [Candidatus Paceibacterota bacterium]
MQRRENFKPAGRRFQAEREVILQGGWHRQAQLGDGDFPMRRTIAKAFGVDDATRRSDFAIALAHILQV